MHKTAVFLYKPEQVEQLPALLERVPVGEAYELIACDLGIEFLLEKRGIPFVSVKEFRTTPSYISLRYAKELGENIFNSPSFAFFSHRGINLARLSTPTLQYYLTRLLYNFDIAAGALEAGYSRAVLFEPSGEDEPLAGAVLELYNLRAFFDAVAAVCAQRGITLDAVRAPRQKSLRQERFARQRFIAQRALFGSCIRALNVFVRAAVPEKKIRILASEYWKNLSPLMRELPEAEVLLVDRAESFAAGWGAILRYRMRFVHGKDFLGKGARREARLKAEKFKKEWEKARQDNRAFMSASVRGYRLTPLLEPALDKIFKASEEVLRDIDGTWAMLEKLKPDAVIVRASVSAQTHFAVLCEVARLLGIPSIEVQHGVFSVGQETLSGDHAAEFIAEYGPLERRMWGAHGYAPRSTCIDVGSPRFDAYRTPEPARPQSNRFTVLHIAPQLTPGEWMDSYDVLSFFETMASAAREVPAIHAVVKLRSGDAESAFFQEAVERAFKGVPHEIAAQEPLIHLFPRVDAVVSCHSTAILEGLLARRPVLLDATLPVHAQLFPADFGPHLNAAALLCAASTQELAATLRQLATHPHERAAQVERASAFMRENYLFADGKSSKRLADFIRSLRRGSLQL